MKKGFMNSPRGNMNAVNNKPGDGLRDLAFKIKNIDGKMIRKPIRGEPNPEFLGVKTSDTLLMKPVIHNPVGQPLKSILKDDRNASPISVKKGVTLIVHDVNMEAAVCSLPEANVSPLSHAKVNGNINTSKVNISMLSNDLVIPGADIALPSVAVDAKTNEYANTLYGYFIGRRHAVPIVDSYVNNAWSRFGLQRRYCVSIRLGGECSYARFVLIEVSAERALFRSPRPAARAVVAEFNSSYRVHNVLANHAVQEGCSSARFL
ncbi:hypothetical protein Tco_0333423 [Tanacetum coccineum]